jgi:hypothetical protein
VDIFNLRLSRPGANLIRRQALSSKAHVVTLSLKPAKLEPFFNLLFYFLSLSITAFFKKVKGAITCWAFPLYRCGCIVDSDVLHIINQSNKVAEQVFTLSLHQPAHQLLLLLSTLLLALLTIQYSTNMLAQDTSTALVITTTVLSTVAFLAIARALLYPVRPKTIRNPLKAGVYDNANADKLKNLVYQPDQFPGARDVETPVSHYLTA